MKYRLAYSLFFIFFCSNTIFAQGTDDSFQQFRQGMLGRYQGFRKSVLDDYAQYLDGVWKRYDEFKVAKRDNTPKPATLPKAVEKPAAPVVIPEPETVKAPEKPKNPEPPAKEKPVVTPPASPVKETPKVPATPQTPKVPAVPTVPTPTPTPTPTPAPAPAPKAENMHDFDFYGMLLQAPKVKAYTFTPNANDAYGKAWKFYNNKDTKVLIEHLNALAVKYVFNDWFRFRLVRAYVNSALSNASDFDKVILQHYILANMKYDVRLARTENRLFLLIPFEEMVYGREYLTMDNKKYFLFFNDDSRRMKNEGIYTCNLPNNVDCGKGLSLILNNTGVNSGKAIQRTLTDGVITVQGEVNENLMEMLRHYPQTDIPEYAKSNLVPAFRKDLLEQIRPQIQGLSQKDAANKLIHFVQHAFGYATDDEQHGYEKPYFLEENFYYPQNDCEDRSIFYAYLVHNLLGLDVHLVHFPGHECTAINFTDNSVDGDAYIYNDKKYIICDPTYVDAEIGVCMPQFQTESPKVELWQ